MEFRTRVEIGRPPFEVEPLERMLFVGSCFADSIGRRFGEEQFRVEVNPYGVMYNPASVLHTVERWAAAEPQRSADEMPRVVFITLGTNHVYRLRSTGEIVDNCQKQPARLFREELLTVDECASYLSRVVERLRSCRRDVNVVLTVSPIRYRKYGFHASQLSKATLLLAVDRLLAATGDERLVYFPAYEIVMDELRDYRFYRPDLLHPSEQAVEYIWELLTEHYLSPSARRFLQEWRPVKEALGHRPFRPESAEYQQFLASTQQKAAELLARYERNS